METRYSAKLRKLEDRILDGPGVLDPTLRRTVAEGHPPGHQLADEYVEKIRSKAYTIVDGTLEQLKAAGWTEDQIFEVSICAAYGAARRRLQAGLRAIQEACWETDRSASKPMGPAPGHD